MKNKSCPSLVTDTKFTYSDFTNNFFVSPYKQFGNFTEFFLLLNLSLSWKLQSASTKLQICQIIIEIYLFKWNFVCFETKSNLKTLAFFLRIGCYENIIGILWTPFKCAIIVQMNENVLPLHIWITSPMQRETCKNHFD